MADEGRAGTAREHARAALRKLQETAPALFAKDGVIVAGIVVVGVAFALAGTTLAVVISAPFFILASPVLIPLVGFGLVAAAGVAMAAALTLLLLLSVSWLYNYVKGRHPPGSVQIDTARSRIVDTANQVSEQARLYKCNFTDYLNLKAREAAAGA